MPKSRHRKNHKKKAQARKVKLQAEKNRQKKAQREMYEQIMMEMQKGNFDNTQGVPTEGIEDANTNDVSTDIGDIELEL